VAKIGIVVQRCHETIVGGSEMLAWHYATLLRDVYDVEILTTTAIDIKDWANVLPAGVEQREGVSIRRFPVTIGRTPYWGVLLHKLFRDFEQYAQRNGGPAKSSRRLPWSISLQEEFIRTQGPHSEPLLRFLRENSSADEAIIFTTYLYPTTYFGIFEVPKHTALMAPTLHDEKTAYLSAFKHAAHRARSIIWLTEAERRVGLKLWGELPGQVVSMSLDTASREPAQLDYPYLLYCGRIDPNKGCVELFNHFIEFKKQRPSTLRLLLTGKDDMPVPSHPDIEFRGFVDDEEKLRLMAGAKVFVMPSGNESFSIVTLEAMVQRVPVLASGVSEVLVDHVNESGAGGIYRDYASFEANLSTLLADENRRAQMGALGREYVASRFTRDRVRTALLAAISSCRGGTPWPPLASQEIR
jgi:glycosyltransferase involved in cell wall biosynthesis